MASRAGTQGQIGAFPLPSPCPPGYHTGMNCHFLNRFALIGGCGSSTVAILTAFANGGSPDFEIVYGAAGCWMLYAMTQPAPVVKPPVSPPSDASDPP
jgi:hypothetical protein